MDVCIVSPGLLFESAGWLGRLKARTGTDGEPAAVAGGAILEAGGTIRQAGYFFSLFRRAWAARLRNVPEELLDVHDPLLCPVELRAAAHPPWGGSSASAATTPDGRDRTRPSTTACASSPKAGNACSRPTVRARALTAADSEPDPAARSEGRLRLKHADMNFRRWSPEIVS